MATTNASSSNVSAGRSAAHRWLESWSPAVISRVTGVLALLWIAIEFLPLNNQLFSTMSAAQVVTWASQNQQEIWINGFERGLANTLMVIVLVLLTWLSMDSGLLASLARVGAAAALAAGWIGAGANYALADLAHRGGAEAGVLALVSLAKTMTYTDGKSFGLAIGAISIMLLRSRVLPWPVAWLGLVTALVLFLAFPIQLAVIGTGNGPQGPVNVILGLLWALVTGITLLVKPVRQPAPAQPFEASASN